MEASVLSVWLGKMINLQTFQNSLYKIPSKDAQIYIEAVISAIKYFHQEIQTKYSELDWEERHRYAEMDCYGGD